MRIRKIFFVITYIFFLLFFFWTVIPPLIDKIIPLGPIYTDVTKRIASPDYTKMAILVRRNAFDLNFGVELQEGPFITKPLHWTRDFLPNLRADWNERIIWSDDSNFLVFTVDDVENNNEKYMWAYDFKNQKEIKNKDEIMNIINLQCEKSQIRDNNSI